MRSGGVSQRELSSAKRAERHATGRANICAGSARGDERERWVAMDSRQSGTAIADTSHWDHESSAADAATTDEPGRVRIARRVLRTVVREAALGVPGVMRVATTASVWPTILGRSGPRDGVALTVNGSRLAVDLYLVVEAGHNFVTVGETVQEAVGAAIEHILGMVANEINVYIRDVE